MWVTFRQFPLLFPFLTWWSVFGDLFANYATGDVSHFGIPASSYNFMVKFYDFGYQPLSHIVDPTNFCCASVCAIWNGASVVEYVKIRLIIIGGVGQSEFHSLLQSRPMKNDLYQGGYLFSLRRPPTLAASSTHLKFQVKLQRFVQLGSVVAIPKLNPRN